MLSLAHNTKTISSMPYHISRLCGPALLILFFSTGAMGQRTTRELRDTEFGKNLLTIGAISPLNGYLCLYYERKIVNRFTLQLGAGITYYTNYTLQGKLPESFVEFRDMSGIQEIQDSNTFDIEDNYTDFQFRKPGLGLAYSLAIKYYFSGNTMSGMYLSPTLEIKQYNAKIKQIDPTEKAKEVGSGTFIPEVEIDKLKHSDTYDQEYMKCTDFFVLLGGNRMARKHVSIGWATGFGVRWMKSQRQDIQFSWQPYPEGHYINASRHFNQLFPSFYVNLTIGGWF
jgi:hypothetical protein